MTAVVRAVAWALVLAGTVVVGVLALVLVPLLWACDVVEGRGPP